jgi:hypothetical protein
MRNLRTLILRAALSALPAAAGCHHDDRPPLGGDPSGSVTIGPGGGQVTGPAGTSVVIPAGALAAPTTVAIAVAPAGAMPALPAGVGAVGPAFALTPHGATFSVPATVHVTFESTRGLAAGAPLRLYTAQPGGTWTAVPRARATAGALDADVTHFSFFVVGYDAPTQALPEAQPRKLDLLFMVDNSLSMAPLQARLVTDFPQMMQTLRNLPGGLPDMHIGVVSSDMGAGPFVDIPNCRPGGDGGRLQAAPRGSCTATALHGNFIATGANETARNYDGTLEDTFSCIALLGSDGCGFEHQLESVAAALGARGAPPPENDGFLRSDALLGIVLVTNEDDCSAPPDAQLFDPASQQLGDPYGPLASYRCNELGHLCGGQAPPRTTADPGTPVTLTDCHSNEDGPLYRVRDYVAMLKALKPDPRQVLVAAVTGPDTPYVVDWVTTPAAPPELGPEVQPSCASGSDVADPAVRLADFTSAFGANGLRSSVCGDLSVALVGIGGALTSALGPRCLQSAVVAPGAPPALADGCTVLESLPAPGGTRIETPLAACAAGGARPCFTLQAEPACAASGAAVVISRDGEPPAGAAIAIRCGS